MAPRRPQRAAWTPKTRETLELAVDVLEDLSEHWPLTLRQIHYAIVSKHLTPNTKEAYNKLSRVMSSARIDGLVPWSAMEDRVRSYAEPYRDADVEAYIGRVVSQISGHYYSRDLLQGQRVMVEVWVEKDALSRFCSRVAEPYGVPVGVARGNSSVTFVRELADRIERRWFCGQRTHLAYFGDLDPSGVIMLPSMLRTLFDEMGVDPDALTAEHAALTVDQVRKFDLPHDPTAIKSKDKQADKFRERYGDVAVELDALPPDTLMALIDEAIRGQLDLELLEEQEREQAAERRRLPDVEMAVRSAIRGSGGAS